MRSYNPKELIFLKKILINRTHLRPKYSCLFK